LHLNQLGMGQFSIGRLGGAARNTNWSVSLFYAWAGQRL